MDKAPANDLDGLRKIQQKQRESLSLLSRPLQTLLYFVLSLTEQMSRTLSFLLKNTIVHLIVSSLIVVVAVLWGLDSSENQYFQTVWAFLRFVVWWLGLGICSSIGLGSGLHTFVLYLGPHLARFTLKATACGLLNFKSAPYDTAQWHQEASWAHKDCSHFGKPVFKHHPTEHGGYYSVPLLKLMAAVELESFLWGFGTAIGELPPYFVSRAARLSGEKVKELEELEEEVASKATTVFQRIKQRIFSGSNPFGFFSLLAFASIPNPLFDLAGLTCGHFLVPFWKFFLATAIGKSLIKTSIQTIFIVAVFNARTVEIVETALEALLSRIPVLQKEVPTIMGVLFDARERFSGTSKKPSESGFSVALLWSAFVMLMLSAFLITIVTSMAQSYLIEKQKRELEALKLKLSRRTGGDLEEKKKKGRKIGGKAIT